jgi:hypothetical protein
MFKLVLFVNLTFKFVSSCYTASTGIGARSRNQSRIKLSFTESKKQNLTKNEHVSSFFCFKRLILLSAVALRLSRLVGTGVCAAFPRKTGSDLHCGLQTDRCQMLHKAVVQR